MYISREHTARNTSRPKNSRRTGWDRIAARVSLNRLTTWESHSVI